MRIGTFPNVGKPAGVVEVESPRVIRHIRELYPLDPITFVRPGFMEFGQLPNIAFRGSIPAGPAFEVPFETTNLPTRGYWPGAYGKTANVIVVDTPEAEAAVRESYPSGSPYFVRNNTMGQEPPKKRSIWRPGTWPVSFITMGIGATIGIIGFLHRKKPMGQLAMGAGGSMIGTSLVLALRDLMD